MKRVAATVLAGLLIAGTTWAEKGHEHNTSKVEEAKITPQTTCPVMGGKINKDLYVDHDGKRVYVCCKGCVDAVKKDPQKYIKKLEAAGVNVAKLQTTCPVMGGKINKDLYVDHDGKRIYVCCKGCIGAVQKDPKKYIEKLEAAGTAVARLQATCPVMGGKINRDLYVDHDGKRIYVCCKGCVDTVKKEPEKHIKKLEANGVVLEPAGQDENAGKKASSMPDGDEGHNH